MNRALAISLALYGLLLAGLALIFYPSFVKSVYRIRAKQRLKAISGEGGSENNSLDKLSQALFIAFGISAPNAAAEFILGSVLLAALVFAALTAAFGIRTAFTGFLFTLPAPALVLLTRLRNRQVDMSREGDMLVTELLGNYRISRFNMREAIERTAYSLEEAPLSKKMLLSLSRELNSASSNEDAVKAIEIFRLAIATSWGDLLAVNLEFAIIDGILVSESLRDLVISVENAKRKLEQTKRETGDSTVILKVLFPAMCALIYIGAVTAFGMTTAEFLHAQFMTKTGITWFFGLIFSYIVSLLVCAHTARQKMDI